MAVNREYLTRQIKKRVGLHVFQAEYIVDAVIDFIIESLAADDCAVRIKSFGSFYVHKRKARIVYNPKTGKEVLAPEKRVMKFKASKHLKSAIDSNINMIVRTYRVDEKRGVQRAGYKNSNFINL